MTITRKNKSKNKSKNKTRTRKNKSNILDLSSRTAAKDKAVENARKKARNNPNIHNLDNYTNAVMESIKKTVIQSKSFSPLINAKLKTMRPGKITSIMGCGLKDNLERTAAGVVFRVNIGENENGSPICVPANSFRGRKIMLHNLSHEKPLNIKNIIPPMQKHSNCWFNTMFMTFFVSDKGKKFMRFFRQLMIEGKLLDGKLIKPKRLSDTFLLFNAAIEACYNHIGTSDDSSIALNTNNIIDNIYKSIPSSFSKNHEGIKQVDQYGNPYSFYKDLTTYLGTENRSAPKITTFKYVADVNNFYRNNHEKINTQYDVIIIQLTDSGARGRATPQGTFPFKKEVIFNNANYKLDSFIARDTEMQHFCCGITCNKKQYLFDGAAFSKLQPKKWSKYTRKNKSWSIGKTKIKWNLKTGYSMLLYYRH
jgi:hypothetical protein